MRPAEVLDHQAATIDYLRSTPVIGYLRSFIEDMSRKGKVKVVGEGVPTLHRNVINSLRIANAFHVQAEMMPVIRSAAMDLDDTDHLVHERLPAEHGFLVFDEGWTTTEVWGKTVVHSAIQWWHGGAMTDFQNGSLAREVPGIWVVLYTDINDERDEVTAAMREKIGDGVNILGRFQIGHIWFLPYGERIGPTEVLTDEEYVKYAWEGQTLAKTTPNNSRMIVALFRLLSQVLVEVKDAPLDRASLRRAKRANLPQRVQTIKLRRKETRFLNPSEGATHVEWQHQWPVRGHWAWRACSAEHPLAEPYEKGHHAYIYIAPYWKGPEDKPVLITEKVWDLSR